MVILVLRKGLGLLVSLFPCPAAAECGDVLRSQQGCALTNRIAPSGFRLAWRWATWRSSCQWLKTEPDVALLRAMFQVPPSRKRQIWLGRRAMSPPNREAGLSAPYQKTAKAGNGRRPGLPWQCRAETAQLRPSMRASAQRRPHGAQLRDWDLPPQHLDIASCLRLLPTSPAWRAELGGVLHHSSRVAGDCGMAAFADSGL